MKTPDKCCELGDYKCQVPMALNERRQDVDYCIADIVAALNAANIKTVASCCGHGTQRASICLEDGRELLIQDRETGHFQDWVEKQRGLS